MMHSTATDLLLMGISGVLFLLLVGWCCVALGREMQQYRHAPGNPRKPAPMAVKFNDDPGRPSRWRVALEEETTRRGIARAIGALVLAIWGKDIPPDDLYLVISGIMAVLGIWQIVRTDG